MQRQLNKDGIDLEFRSIALKLLINICIKC
jgi:hypothetical protein